MRLTKQTKDNKLFMIVEQAPTSMLNIENKETIDSYAQLVKALSELENKNSEILFTTVAKTNLTEGDETNYNNLPLKIMFKQIPAVINGDLLVKIVVLQQADKFALIVPENVSKIYEGIKDIDDKDSIKSNLTAHNINLALYAEVYGFDTDNSKFIDIIKSSYLAAGNFIKAFELVGEDIIEEPKDDEQSGDDNDFAFDGAPTDTMSFDAEDIEISEPVDSLPEVTENVKAYKKFTNKTKALNNLAVKIHSEATEVLKSNTRFKYLGSNKAVLIIEVNNKSIYDAFPKTKNIAKQTISKLGESIRKNKDTQLVDSFNIKGRRYFVLVENHDRNYWIVSREKLEIPEAEAEVVQPIQSGIIRLAKSSVRKESRINKPYRINKKIVFKETLK